MRRQVATFASRAGMRAPALTDVQVFGVRRCAGGAIESSMRFALGRT